MNTLASTFCAFRGRSRLRGGLHVDNGVYRLTSESNLSRGHAQY